MNSELLKQGEAVSWVSLGSVAERVFRTNASLKYGLSDVRGVTNTKEIAPTKANVSERALEKFYVVQPEEFVFNRRVHGTGTRRLGLGFNSSNRDFIFTEDYVAFSVKKDKILPAFLFLFFCREDFNRYVVTNSWGSATEFFNWDDMCRVKIPLPPIEVQRAYVEVYKGLTALIEENEVLLKSLEDAAQACVAECREMRPFIEHCRKRSSMPSRSSVNSELLKEIEVAPLVMLGDLLEVVDARGGNVSRDKVDGVNVNKAFVSTVANLENSDLSKYKRVQPGTFAANLMHIGRDGIFPVALNTTESMKFVSPAYFVFRVKAEERILPLFLFILFRTPSFDRRVWFATDSSIRGNLTWDDMCRVRIPLPPIEIQKAIVALYRCAEEARSIADEARVQLAQACPAIIQQAAHRR